MGGGGPEVATIKASSRRADRWGPPLGPAAAAGNAGPASSLQAADNAAAAPGKKLHHAAAAEQLGASIDMASTASASQLAAKAGKHLQAPATLSSDELSSGLPQAGRQADQVPYPSAGQGIMQHPRQELATQSSDLDVVMGSPEFTAVPGLDSPTHEATRESEKTRAATLSPTQSADSGSPEPAVPAFRAPPSHVAPCDVVLQKPEDSLPSLKGAKSHFSHDMPESLRASHVPGLMDTDHAQQCSRKQPEPCAAADAPLASVGNHQKSAFTLDGVEGLQIAVPALEAVSAAAAEGAAGEQQMDHDPATSHISRSSLQGDQEICGRSPEPAVLSPTGSKPGQHPVPGGLELHPAGPDPRLGLKADAELKAAVMHSKEAASPPDRVQLEDIGLSSEHKGAVAATDGVSKPHAQDDLHRGAGDAAEGVAEASGPGPNGRRHVLETSPALRLPGHNQIRTDADEVHRASAPFGNLAHTGPSPPGLLTPAKAAAAAAQCAELELDPLYQGDPATTANVAEATHDDLARLQGGLPEGDLQPSTGSPDVLAQDSGEAGSSVGHHTGSIAPDDACRQLPVGCPGESP